MSNILYIVIPCYNEEEVLPETARQLKEKVNNLIKADVISNKSRVLLIDNGSWDKTWEIINVLHKQDKLFVGISLAKNHGHQNGLLAGLMLTKQHSDMVITMDADLQDDINAIDEMLQKYYLGNDVVYGVRNSRSSDSFFKRFTAELFYKFMKLMGVDIVFNHGDFRLMSKRVLEALSEYREVNLFLRGIVPDIGFNSDCVYHERHARFAGKSKYGLSSLFSLAANGITSFSVKPLKIITAVGITISVISMLAFIWFFIGGLRTHTDIGWPSIMCSIWGLGGLQIIFLGIIGEYIGKIYFEAKGRPRYVIKSILLDE